MKKIDYVVGKGRPPMGTRWKPGQSGNPKGRPKGVKNMLTYFHEALNRQIDVKVSGKIRRMSAREGIAMNTTNLALKGDVKIIPLVIAIEREASAVMERKNFEKITADTSPQEAWRSI
jgi:hypothetical protein